MLFKRLSRTAIIAVVAGISWQAPAWSETLTDALIAAYQTSGLLQQNRALLRAADEDVAKAVGTLRPVIIWAASANYSNPSTGDELTGSLRTSLDWLLYDFGRSQLSIDLQKEAVLATRESLKSVEQQVLLRAVGAYLDVRRQNALVGLRENNVRLITQQLRAARDRFEVGEVTRTDVSIAEARLAAARSGLAAAQGALAQAREEYKASTGAFPSRLQPPPATPGTAANLPAAREIALDRHPDLLKAQRDVTVAELAVAVAAGALKPSLRGSASFGVDQDGDDSTSLGLTLSGPIYRGGQITSDVRRAQASRDAARAGLYTTAQTVEQNVGNAWADLAVARASREASDQQVRASRLALRGAQEELQVGARTTLDVLDREQELLDAQTSLITAEIDQTLAAYRLLSTMGLLTVDHLKLGIATYDPAAYYNAVKDAPTVLVSPQGERLDRVMRSLNRN